MGANDKRQITALFHGTVELLYKGIHNLSSHLISGWHVKHSKKPHWSNKETVVQYVEKILGNTNPQLQSLII